MPDDCTDLDQALERARNYGPGSTDGPGDVLKWRALLRRCGHPASARTLSRRLAEDFIAGRKAMRVDEVDALWKACKTDEAFSHARRVLMRRRSGSPSNILPAAPGYQAPDDGVLRDHAALMTSKDPDLSASVRHAWALELLSPRLEDSRPETLGIAGGIWKRRWEFDGKVSSLEQSLRHYLAPVERHRAEGATDQAHDRGGQGVTAEDGYPAINAAFVCDLLARQTSDQASHDEFVRRARQLRERICASVTGSSYWVLVTIAEAHFGLGRIDEAVARMHEARKAQPDPWERDTTARQIARLGAARRMAVGDTTRVVAALIGDDQSAAAHVQSILVGKVGLALSGGGFRASLYHLGVLARLAESDVLRHVEALSTVSGGSMVGAAYYLRLRALLQEDGHPKHERYVALVKALIDDFVQAMAANLRSGLFMDRRVCTAVLSGDDETYAKAMSEAVFKVLYGRTVSTDPHMSALAIRPRDAPADFHPRYHNAQRGAKVPALLLNAAVLNTGHSWQFTTTSMGESPFSIVAGADPLPRLRRSNYLDAQGKVVRGVTLSQAVAASACVPGLFAPLTLKNLYEGYDVRLVDGGVHDNQGALALLQEDCNVLIVSDGCGQLGLDKQAGGGHVSPLARSFGIFQERMRLASYARLRDARDGGRLAGLACVHLKKDLDAPPVDWLRCEDPSRPGDQLPPTSLDNAFTSYGVWKPHQELLADIRTDLDVFSEIESAALMADGYMAMDAEMARLALDVPALDAGRVKPGWFFSPLVARLASSNQPLLEKHLRAGSKQFLRVMKIDAEVRKRAWIGLGLFGVVALVAIVLAWHRTFSISVGAVVLALGLFVATTVVRRLFGEQTPAVFLVDPLGTVRKRAIRHVAGLGGWLLARWLVPRLTKRYVEQGRLARLDDGSRAPSAIAPGMQTGAAADG